MKTIKQIADEIGEQKGTVYKRITREPLKTSMQVHVHDKEGVAYIDVHGENLIKSIFKKDKTADMSVETRSAPPQTFSDVRANVHSEIYNAQRETIEILKAQLEAKDDQLKIKDRQIEDLTATVRTQAESINADRKNELAGTLIDGQKILIEEKSEKKQGFFEKLFKKKE